MTSDTQDHFPQNEMLNTLRKERKRVQIFLINGIRLVGTIESFDAYLIMLSTPTGVQGIYKRAISTVQVDTGTRPPSTRDRPRDEHTSSTVITRRRRPTGPPGAGGHGRSDTDDSS
ncbi:RNA chaperone Hfq [Pararobbsia silviterrae]|uniref:RNA-binding protein Hfq n=1 Tax=Pararobbsia silviterrae TaxID=1792498 RepID=A0A494X5Y0_9BURK|nr:RNA chaperone Hfq [Pararobbsia silviterrae]RKP45790.1 RNA chaperone Hfq [Pararobbsia silviterrae]